MKIPTPNALWKVSLSNGETFHESKTPFHIIEGSLSPWNRLKMYCEECDTPLTSMSLWTEDGKTFNLPSGGKNPRFKQALESEKPLSYNFFRIRCFIFSSRPATIIFFMASVSQ